MKVFDSGDLYVIQTGKYHDTVYTQRKRVVSNTDIPLSGAEMAIISLCQEIVLRDSSTPPETVALKVYQCPRCGTGMEEDQTAVHSATRAEALPLEPTKEMIEAGAQRLVRWETGKEVWPDAWSKLDVRASRNDAERVWRSMWLVAHGIEAPLSGDGPPVPPNHQPKG